MTFDPFGDFETEGYLRNSLKLKDPVEVKESEHLSFEASIEEALAYLAKRRPINYQAVLKTHEILFAGFYPWSGKDRNELVPHLAVFKGSLDDPHHTPFERPELIKRSIEYALELAANKKRFRDRPGEVMGQLASAHPFLDGNGLSCSFTWSCAIGPGLPSIGPRPTKMHICERSATRSAIPSEVTWTNI
jgi:cell filamentation protein